MTQLRGMNWPLVLGTAGVALTAYYLLPVSESEKEAKDVSKQEDSDPPSLQGFSSYESYKTSYTTYPRIRTFYHPHAHQGKLRAIDDLPLLVFIHGFGGVLPQFVPLLGSLVGIAPCFAIELPGHGRSDFEPKDYAAYTTEAFTALWKVAIDQVCVKYGHKKVVLITHSMGGSFAALLATQTKLEADLVGIIALCPKSKPPTKNQTLAFRTMLSLPEPILNGLRWFDKRGGEESKSVKRLVGEGADANLKRLQLQYNQTLTTQVLKRAGIGFLPNYDTKGNPHGGLPDLDTWSQIQTPLLLISGEADPVTPTKDLKDIVSSLQKRPTASRPSSQSHISPPVPFPISDKKDPSNSELHHTPKADDRAYGIEPTISTSPTTTTKHLTSRHSVGVKTAVLPAPASHALMYDHATYRTVAGLIEDFLSRYVSEHLSLGWQLTQLTTSGKWDVKNLEKWKRTLEVSTPLPSKLPTTNNNHNQSINRKHPLSSSSTGSLTTTTSDKNFSKEGMFHALKTLREQDETHSPIPFMEKWGDQIGAVIDISHDAPVYDTKALERGGIEYHKFPTVSKVPPTVIEVRDFIALVDRLRAEMETKALETKPDNEGSTGSDRAAPSRKSTPRTKPKVKAIAVHCHYGYNRTGFFICCYLIERLGLSVEEALSQFAQAKPPGIKHDHFVDTLYVRYCFGLKRANTSDVVDDGGEED